MSVWRKVVLPPANMPVKIKNIYSAVMSIAQVIAVVIISIGTTVVLTIYIGDVELL